MTKSLVKLKKPFMGNLTFYYSILPLFFILALSPVLLPIAPNASTEPSFSPYAEMTLAKTVDFSSPKPGDKVNFTITYSNGMRETAHNVTIFERMPSGLTFVSSKPFYDGVSDPESGFYRWSRGNVPPRESGTVIVKAMVENVPVETVISNTAYLSYEFENGTRVEVTSSVDLTVTQAAGVDVYPDEIHSVPPYTYAETEFNVTVTNNGNGLDTFNISLRSVAFNPSASAHDWKIKLYNSTGYPNNPVATVFDDNQYNRTSWTDHGVLTSVTLASGESTWFMIKVIEAEGTSGSGNAYLDVLLIATSLFDQSVSDSVDKMTIVKSRAGITLGPDYSSCADPGDTVIYRHIIVNGGQTEVVDLNYTSSKGWSYSFWFDNGTALQDTDGSGYTDVGQLPQNEHVYILAKVTVPYGTAAGINDTAVITATGVTSGAFDNATDTTVVKSAPVLGVEKKLVSDSPRYVGDVVTYQINITNLGNTRLTTIPLDDAFETLSLNFSSSSPAEDSYDETAGNIRWENITALDSNQSTLVSVNFVATAADEIVRESASVIDAEDEFGNLISATYLNTELRIIGFHTLTVTASPTEALGGNFRVSWTERGVLKDDTFATKKEITCDQDTTAEVSDPESPITKGDVRYVFAQYTPSATVTMDSDKTITLNYRTEYTLTFQQVGSGEPVYITVNGTRLTEALPQSFWVEKGSTTTFSYPSPVLDAAGTTRYVLTEVSGSTTDTWVTVDASTNVVGHYKTQYYLSVTTVPVGLDNPQHSGWYDPGTHAQIEVETPTGGDGVSTRFRFDHWTGIGIADTSKPSTQIVMDAPKTATARYVRQYYITVVSPHDAPTPSRWVDEGGSLTASVTSPADDDGAGTRHRCTGYRIDEGGVEEGTSHTFLDVEAAHKIEFDWISQRYLTVKIYPADVPATISGEGWYDENSLVSLTAPSPVSVSEGVQYRFDRWTIDSTASTTNPTEFNMDAPKVATAVFIEQFYLTMSTNFGAVNPDSGWHDAGSTVSIEATTPEVVEGKGYVWHGWTGTGEGSYSGIDNPATVTMNSPIGETAYWKISPLLTITISNETIASGDRIVVYGKALPASSDAEISVTYVFPNGTQIEHVVYTNNEGDYEDELLLDQGYLYSLFAYKGEWVITARRLGDTNLEESQASTTLKIEAPSIVQVHPAVLAGLILAGALVAYVLIIRKVKNNKNAWWRATVILCCAGLILGVASLALNWVFVTGTATIEDVTYHVGVLLYPFGNGLVSITRGIQYVGTMMPSMIDPTWRNIIGSSGPVLTLWLIPVGCSLLLLAGLYKPKNVRQRSFKVAILVISGVLIIASVVQALVFVQGQVSTLEGAGIGYGAGVYLALIGGTLTLLSGLFAHREALPKPTKAKKS